MLHSLLKRFWTYVVVAVIAALITWALIPDKVKIEEKLVTEVQERVIVHTRIVERPDGTKETIIEEERNTDSRSESSKVTTSLPDYSVGLSQSINGVQGSKPTYGIRIEKRLLGSLSGGIYARSDKEYGVALSYSF